MSVVASTRQYVEFHSAEGAKLVKKLLRDLGKSGVDITLHARNSDDWRVEVRKTIKGEIGEPDCEVVIRTDLVIGSPNPSEYGHKSGDSRSQPVTIPPLRSMMLMFGSDVKTFLELTKAGWDWSVNVSRGSISSSEHNLGFAYLEARKGWQSVRLGSETVFVNGVHVCRGVVE